MRRHSPDRAKSFGSLWVDRFNLLGKGSCPAGGAEPVEVKGHDETVSGYGENQRPCLSSIFLISVVHNLSPSHSGCEQFIGQCDWRHLFRFFAVSGRSEEHTSEL